MADKEQFSQETDLSGVNPIEHEISFYENILRETEDKLAALRKKLDEAVSDLTPNYKGKYFIDESKGVRKKIIRVESFHKVDGLWYILGKRYDFGFTKENTTLYIENNYSEILLRFQGGCNMSSKEARSCFEKNFKELSKEEFDEYQKYMIRHFLSE